MLCLKVLPVSRQQLTLQAGTNILTRRQKRQYPSLLSSERYTICIATQMLCLVLIYMQNYYSGFFFAVFVEFQNKHVLG